MNKEKLPATKARAMTNAANESAIQPCLDAVWSTIQEAAQSGKSNIKFYCHSNYKCVDPKIIMKELKNMGYKVENEYRDYPTLIIYW